MANHKTWEAGDVILGQYEIVSQIGRGGFGVVYKCRQVRTGQVVAVKTVSADLSEDEVRRFQAELDVLAKLSHPHLVQLIDGGPLETGIALVLEFVDGDALGDLLKAQGPMSPQRASRLMRQLLEALQVAHEQGIIHRDLKPANIMITGNAKRPVAKLLDFGIATASEEYDGDWETLTATGFIAGTPSYMAPELLISDPKTGKRRRADERSDLYAIGLILLECLTGQRVVSGNTPVEICMRQLHHEVPIPVALRTSPLVRIVQKACDKNPARRYASAEEMLDALDALGELPNTSAFADGSEAATQLLALSSPVTPSATPLAAHEQPTVFTPAPSIPPLLSLNEAPPTKPKPTSGRPILLVVLGVLAALIVLAVVFLPTQPPERAPSPSPVIPKATEVATSATLEFLSAPPGAEVFEGDVRLGRTPFIREETKLQSHTYRFVLQGHRAHQLLFPLQPEMAGRPLKIEAKLEPLPTITWTVRSKPSGARLVAGGQELCPATPCTVSRSMAIPTNLQASLQLRGYREASVTLPASGGAVSERLRKERRARHNPAKDATPTGSSKKDPPKKDATLVAPTFEE